MAYNTKKAARWAIKSLPALRASLIWHKREVLRCLRRSAQEASSLALRRAYEAKALRVAKADLADLRVSYLTERVSEIRAAPLFELGRIVPELVRLRAEVA